MRQVSTDLEDVRQLHEATEEVEREFRAASLGYRGRVLTFEWAGAVADEVDHGLGRVPVGWVVVDLNAAVTIHRSADLDSKKLTLTSSGAAKAQVLVY